MTAPDHYGWISLIPALSVLGLALYSKRTFEALLGGCIIGYLMAAGGGFFGAFTPSLPRAGPNILKSLDTALLS